MKPLTKTIHMGTSFDDFLKEMDPSGDLVRRAEIRLGRIKRKLKRRKRK